MPKGRRLFSDCSSPLTGTARVKRSHIRFLEWERGEWGGTLPALPLPSPPSLAPASGECKVFGHKGDLQVFSGYKGWGVEWSPQVGKEGQA